VKLAKVLGRRDGVTPQCTGVAPPSGYVQVCVGRNRTVAGSVRHNAQMVQSEREARLFALLEDNVRTELQIANGMLDLGLSGQNLDRIMEGVTSGILYAFDVEWSPDWVKDGDVHAWEEDGGWLARCSACLTDSPRSDSREDAASWARAHESSH